MKTVRCSKCRRPADETVLAAWANAGVRVTRWTCPACRERADACAARETDTVRLAGRIVRQTDQAVLFAVNQQVARERGQDEAVGREMWLPLSQVGVYERGLGPLDEVEVPGWLYREKTR